MASPPEVAPAPRRDMKLRMGVVQLAMAIAVSAWAVFSWVPGRSTPWTTAMVSPADDALTHAEFGAGAGEAMAEGQWPIRELPRVNDAPVARDALFQFYAVAPYALSGVLCLFGINLWHALVIAVFISFVIGYLGAWLLARELGAGVNGATLGAVAFSWAPYHLTDWFGRAAWPELFAFAVLPWVFWSNWRLALRCDALRVAVAGLAWAVLVLSHNIFHVWSVPIVGVLLAWEAWVARRPGLVPWRVIPGYLLGLAVGFFFFAGPLLLGPSFQVTGRADPFLAAAYSPLTVLLAPFWTQSPESASAPNMGLQVGWPMLLGAVGFILIQGRNAPRNGFLILFLLTIFIAWSPVNFWRFLGPFNVIQFPYRVLTFTAVFGGVLIAFACDRLRWRPRIVLAVALAVHAAWSLNWKAVTRDVSSARLESHFREVGATPRCGLGYAIADAVLSGRYALHDLRRGHDGVIGNGPGLTCWLAPAGSPPVVVSAALGRRSEMRVRSAGGVILVLDRLWYPGLWGVRVNGAPAITGFVGPFIAVELPPDDATVEWWFAGWWWADAISLVALAVTVGLLLWSMLAARAKSASARSNGEA